MLFGKRFFIAALLLATTQLAVPSSAKAGIDRDRLVYRLQNIVNEFELLIRNHRADLSDLRRQKRHMEYLKVFERIPFESDLGGLERQLRESAANSGVEFVRAKVVAHSPLPEPVPTVVRSDGPRFEFSKDQLLEELFLQLLVRGPEEKIRAWLSRLPDVQVRLVNANPAEMIRDPSGAWAASARAYRFRNVRFPKILPVDPRKIEGVTGARSKDVNNLMARATALRAQTTPLYDTRGEILLNAARMRIFSSKAGT